MNKRFFVLMTLLVGLVASAFAGTMEYMDIGNDTYEGKVYKLDDNNFAVTLLNKETGKNISKLEATAAATLYFPTSGFICISSNDLPTPLTPEDKYIMKILNSDHYFMITSYEGLVFVTLVAKLGQNDRYEIAYIQAK